MNDFVPMVPGSMIRAKPSGPAAPIAEDGAEFGTLASVMDQYAAMVGADGTVVTLHEPGCEGAVPLFSGGACAGDTELVREAVELAPSSGETRRGQDAPIRWDDDRIHSGAWMSFRVAGGDDKSYLRIHALYPRAGGEVRRIAEAAGSRMRPLISGFLRLWSLHGRSKGRLAGLTAALDQSDVGVLLLDRRGRILFENREATILLDAQDGIRRRNRSLGASNLSDALRLQVAVNHVLICEEDRAAHKNCAAVVALQRGGGRRPLLVSVASPHCAGPGGDVAALVSVFDPEQDLKPLMQPACTLYGLSPVEARLACLIANGEPLAAAAKALRIREHTARSYLKQIFIKTDTNRQADLVRLLLTSAVRTIDVPRFEMV